MVLSLPDGRRGGGQNNILNQIQELMPFDFQNSTTLLDRLIEQRRQKATSDDSFIAPRGFTRGAGRRAPGDVSNVPVDGGGLSSLIKNIAGEVQGATTNSVPAGLGAQAGLGIGVTNAPQESSDPLMDQMLALLQAGAGGVDTSAYESAMADQARAIRQGYRGQIRGLREEQDLARERGGENRGEVDKMYRALAQQQRRAARKENRQGQRAADEVTQRAAQSAEMLNESATGRNEEMLERAAALGIQDALGGVLPESTARDNERAAAIVGEGSRAANREAGAGRSSARALRENALSSRREGLDTVSGMMQDEEDFIRGIGREIQGLRASRASDLASNRAAIAAQIAQAQGSSNSELFKSYLDLAKFQLDRDNSQIDNDLRRQMLMMQMQGQGAEQQSYLPKELVAIDQLMAQTSPGVQGIVQDALANPDQFGLAKGPGGDTVPMNMAHMTQLIQSEAQARGITLTPQDMQNALGALMTAGRTVRN